MKSSKEKYLAGLVLAAGQSTRFGADKRLAAYNDGDTLLTKSIALIEPFCGRIFVATRAGEIDQGKRLLGRWWGHDKVEQVCARDAAHGMGNTLSNLMERIREFEKTQQEDFTGALLMLADMPYIESATISKVVAAHSVDNIALPCYQEHHERKRRGHPVVFGRKWFDALSGLQGDRGAKNIIENNPACRVETMVEDTGIFRDVDEPQDIS